MGTIRPESKAIEEVRRWRKEAYDARQRMTPAQLIEHDRRVVEALGLSHLREEKVTSPWEPKTSQDAA